MLHPRRRRSPSRRGRRRRDLRGVHRQLVAAAEDQYQCRPPRPAASSAKPGQRSTSSPKLPPTPTAATVTTAAVPYPPLRPLLRLVRPPSRLLPSFRRHRTGRRRRRRSNSRRGSVVFRLKANTTKTRTRKTTSRTTTETTPTPPVEVVVLPEVETDAVVLALPVQGRVRAAKEGQRARRRGCRIVSGRSRRMRH